MPNRARLAAVPDAPRDLHADADPHATERYRVIERVLRRAAGISDEQADRMTPGDWHRISTGWQLMIERVNGVEYEWIATRGQAGGDRLLAGVRTTPVLGGVRVEEVAPTEQDQARLVPMIATKRPSPLH